MAEPLKPDYPVVTFAGPSEWEAWLAENHASAAGVWLRMGRKKSQLQTVSYAEALDVALCYGWIDGQSRSYDDSSWVQKFTPRGRRSIWSRINRDRVEGFIREGRMQPAGLAAIEAAKTDGRWDRAYDSPANATVPDDFRAALAARPEAAAFFDTLKGQARYAFLHRIQTAVKPETRARRIAQFVDTLARKETLR